MFTANIALIGFNYPAIIWLLLNIQYCCITVDFSATGTGAFGQRLSEVRRLYIAIVWVLYSPNNALDIGHWPGF